MTIHKEGYSTIAVVFVLVSALFYLAFSTIECNVIFYIISFVLFGFFTFIVSFFRIPKRVYTIEDGALVAPADGKIVVVEEVEETEYLNTKCRQISIFMSPLNVHVNRYPIAGKILFSKHHAGLKLPAFNPKSSTENERTTIVLQTEKGSTILFRQIAGAVARRIVNYAKEGDVATQTQEFGFIKFGSRVDLFIPLDMKVEVALDQKVCGGQTILAR